MLDSALSIADGDEGLVLALTVRNDGDEPVTLRFRTGQRADFAAYEGDDDGSAESDLDTAVDDAVVWRHGTGRMFTQVLGSETLTPGESVTYESTWRDPPPGSYRIVGALTDEKRNLTATATVDIQ